MPRAAAFCAESEAGDLSVPVGRPVAARSLRLQAEARETARQDLPESIRDGQRLTGMTAYQSTFPTAPSIYKFAQHGKSGAWLERSAAAHGADCRRTLLHQIDAHRADQSRSGDHVFADRLSAGRAAEPGRVDRLWAGQREQRSARVCGDDLRRPRTAAISRCTTACGAAAFCRRSIRA